MSAATTFSRRELDAELAELRVQLAALERQPARTLGGSVDSVRESRIDAVTKRSNVIRYRLGLLDELDSHIAATARHESAADRHQREAERNHGRPAISADLAAEARRERVEAVAARGRLEHVRGLLAKEAAK